MAKVFIDQMTFYEFIDNGTKTITCKECGKGFGKLAHYTMYGIKICNSCCESKPTIKDGHGLYFHHCGNYCHIGKD